MDKVINFLRDVRVELSKVTWPTKEQLAKYTLIVIGISAFIAIFLGIVDFGLQKIIDRILR